MAFYLGNPTWGAFNFSKLKDLLQKFGFSLPGHRPEPEPEPAPNIVEIAAGSDDFNLLVKALSTAGLVETIQNSDDITVFAPTDAAFTQLALDLGYAGDQADEDSVFDFLVEALGTLGDPVELLTDILLYHVSAGAKSAAEIEALDAVPTLLGVSFESENGELLDLEPDIDNPSIATPDIEASNGTIQVIDRVLLPIDIPGNEPAEPNIVEIAAGSDDFNLLVKALSTAGLVETIQNSADITVFAPTDGAFTKLATDLGYNGDEADEDAVFGFLVEALDGLSGGDPVGLLTDILLYHVTPGNRLSTELGDEVPTLLGETIRPVGLELVDRDADVDNPEIVIPDIDAANGKIQAIDAVLLPVNVPGNGHAALIEGTDGRDRLTGTRNDDEIFGDAGNDKLIGRKGDDLLVGGEGHDRLNGGRGDDMLFGGDGDDTFVFRNLRGDDTVGDLEMGDRVLLNRHEFHNFRELKHNVEFVDGDAVIDGDRGSITLSGIDESAFTKDLFVFV